MRGREQRERLGRNPSPGSVALSRDFATLSRKGRGMLFAVMAGLVPAIHVFGSALRSKTWMPGRETSLCQTAHHHDQQSNLHT